MREETVFDYVRWRGDVRMEESEFNAIDGLILTQIIYLPLEGSVPPKRSTRSVTLQQAAEHFFAFYHEPKEHLGFLIPREIIDLFRIVAGTKRYSELLLESYENSVKTCEEIQFCAMTVRLVYSNEVLMVFRGTDDTLVGWKEDLNMSYMPMVPSQKAAIRYAKYVRKKQEELGRNINGIWFAGHSKGGNLAVCAAAFAMESDSDIIRRIFNFDGPGFESGIYQCEKMRSVRAKVRSFVPENSVVGLLLAHKCETQIVRSIQSGFRQHDALTWCVNGTDFVYAKQMTEISEALERSMEEWIKQLNGEDARKFVDALYRLAQAGNAKTLSDLLNGGNHSLLAVIRAYSTENAENKRLIRSVLRNIYTIWRENARKIHKIRNNSANNVDKSL